MKKKILASISLSFLLLLPACQSERALPTEAPELIDSTDSSSPAEVDPDGTDALASAQDQAGTGGRRHSARIDEVFLSGTLVEAGTGLPVYKVVVRVHGKSTQSKTNGVYRFRDLPVGPTTVTFDRIGFLPVSMELDLKKGYNVVDLQLQPTPYVTVTDVNGAVHEIDAAEIGFRSVYPLLGSQVLPVVDFCTLEGGSRMVTLGELSTVEGTGNVVDAPPCCPRSFGTRLTLGFKSGERAEVITRDCQYYQVTFGGFDRRSGVWDEIPMRDIRLIDLTPR